METLLLAVGMAAGADWRLLLVGELRSGASLRAALRTACSARPDAARLVRRLEVGEPLPFAVTGLDRLVPTVGRLVEAAVTSGGDGGRMLPVFEELLVHATAEEQAAAELQTALAPVRASMVVLVGAPAAMPRGAAMPFCSIFICRWSSPTASRTFFGFGPLKVTSSMEAR